MCLVECIVEVKNMTALKNAPLIYTLGMIQFPKVPGIDRFTDFFLDKMRHEYPLGDEIKVPVFNADVRI